MISIQLPDGSKREFPGPVTVGEVRAGETTSLDSTTRRSGDVLTISVPELQVGTILVVQPRPGP